MDDDKDGGIEVDESDEVGGKLSLLILLNFPIIHHVTPLHL